MKDMIIKSLEVIVWIVAGFYALAGVLGGLFALVQGELVGLALIIGGPIVAVLIAGGMFIGIGIHDNTRRTAAAMEKLAAR